MRREDQYVADIVIAARHVAEYVTGIDASRFTDDTKTRAAVTRELIVIGEAVKHLSPEFRAEHPAIPWRAIAGMRDVLTHAYFRASTAEVWDAAINGCPALLRELEPLLPPPPPDRTGS